jgi:hypothetical protein
MRLAADGKPIKTVAQTSREYAGLFPDEPVFLPFAALYTRLRYRVHQEQSVKSALHAALWEEYRRILAHTRRRGFRAAALRIFSLRGLAYLWK